MTVVVSGAGRLIPAAISGLFMGCGLALWLCTTHNWRWWTAGFAGWMFTQAVTVAALAVTAPNDGRGTRPDDPE